MWLNFVCECVGKKLRQFYSLKTCKNENTYLYGHKYSENSNKKCSKKPFKSLNHVENLIIFDCSKKETVFEEI